MPVVKRPKGIRCPVCLKQARCAYLRYRPLYGVRIRYFRCECGARFKTVERLQEPKKE